MDFAYRKIMGGEDNCKWWSSNLWEEGGGGTFNWELIGIYLVGVVGDGFREKHSSVDFEKIFDW